MGNHVKNIDLVRQILLSCPLSKVRRFQKETSPDFILLHANERLDFLVIVTNAVGSSPPSLSTLAHSNRQLARTDN
jgi:hypothetical protein